MNGSADELIDQGIEFQANGKLDEAEQAYSTVLRNDPENPDALHLLGVVTHLRSNHLQAIELISKALSFDDQAAEFWHNLGEAQLAAYQFSQAIASYQRAIELDPSLLGTHRRLLDALLKTQKPQESIALARIAVNRFPADAPLLNSFGLLLRMAGDEENAARAFRNAIITSPGEARYHRNLAICLLSMKDSDSASVAREAARLSPDDPAALTTCASILVDHSLYFEAEDLAKRALELDQSSGEAHFLLGFCLAKKSFKQAAFETLEKAIALSPTNEKAQILFGMVADQLFHEEIAAEAFAAARRINPRSIDALINFGVIQFRRGRHQDAFEAFTSALALDSENPQANAGLGVVMHNRNKVSEAEELLRKSLRLKPENADAMATLGHNLMEQGEIREAGYFAAKACESPQHPLFADNNRLMFLLYDPSVSADEKSQKHREWGENVMKWSPSVTRNLRSIKIERRLRIGYVSPDFRGHAVAFFIEPVLENHDRERFEIYCYSNVLQEDLVTQRIRGLADHWINICSMTDDQVAARMVEDEIDILVDLAGHTGGGRLYAFAQSPAPIQVSYIGYPSTTGLPTMNYRISDALLDPPGPDDTLYVEKTIRVDGFWTYRPLDVLLQPVDLPALSGEPFTFGSFNNVAKFNDDVISTWSRILHGVPDAHLMLKYKILDDPGVAQRLVKKFAAHGISEDRIDIWGSTSLIEHQAQHNHVDLGLDPFPFNGGTTTFHSFYMGVPVVALEGRGHASRMGAALLRHVDLPELIAHSVDEYVDIAVKFAKDLPRLRDVRRTLRSRLEQSPLMNHKLHTQQLEEAFRKMYEEYAAKEQLSGPSGTRASDPARIVVDRTVFPARDGQVRFSIIMCGQNAIKRARSTERFSKIFGKAGTEILYVSSPPSLAAGYNAALSECKSDLILFAHDDIDIRNSNAAEIIENALQTFDMVGVAGTNNLMSGSWVASGQPYIFGQVAHRSSRGFLLATYGGTTQVTCGIQALDGLLIAAKRSAADQIRFDEQTFTGFHLYDVDFTYRAFLAGLKLAVLPDLLVIHDSTGNYNLTWKLDADKFSRKFSNRLPDSPPQKFHFATETFNDEETVIAKMRNRSVVDERLGKLP